MLTARREKEMVERPWHRKKELVKSNEKALQDLLIRFHPVQGELIVNGMDG